VAWKEAPLNDIAELQGLQAEARIEQTPCGAGSMVWLHRSDLLLQTLPRVRCPVAGIWGAEDVLYRGRSAVVEHALRQAPAFRSLVFIAHAGHRVQYEDAATFTAALASALSEP
jgi:pimeloyl-ACP methyl ester carboxylesterase